MKKKEYVPLSPHDNCQYKHPKHGQASDSLQKGATLPEISKSEKL